MPLTIDRLRLSLAFAPSQQFGLVVAIEPTTPTTNGRNQRSLAATIGGDLGPKSRQRGTPLRRVEVAEMLLHDGEDIRRHRPHAGMGASTARRQRAGASAVTKPLQPAKHRRPADPEGRHCVADLFARRPLGQRRKNLRPTLRRRPLSRTDVVKIHGPPCKTAAIWFHKLRIKLDASSSNCESIPKLCNRQIHWHQ
ncbi:hypothetical protein SAMN06265338_12515 [Rhodoblastus acidophilus]|uniref:Uncharacterized protein n=1 Tax=Rhodoblastus acidophilus TaxID=1074 RepID=A0A212SCI5_RHOAC|nr:hypothetical protein SAMN06265338_12515 [Rhodoblastus acidophilus]